MVVYSVGPSPADNAAVDVNVRISIPITARKDVASVVQNIAIPAIRTTTLRSIPYNGPKAFGSKIQCIISRATTYVKCAASVIVLP